MPREFALIDSFVSKVGKHLAHGRGHKGNSAPVGMPKANEGPNISKYEGNTLFVHHVTF